MKRRFATFTLASLLLIAAALTIAQSVRPSAAPETVSATWSQSALRLTIPYRAPHAGAGQLTVEILDPEDSVLARVGRRLTVAEGKSVWQEELRPAKPLAMEDLVWHRVRYRFVWDARGEAPIEAIDSISEILRRPVVH